MVEKIDPTAHIGEHYEEGMLPYGGRVSCDGIITFAVSEEEFLDKMKRLESIR